jgi:type III pantothenate kinase
VGTILVLDRGNRSLKCALFHSGRIVKRWLDDSSSPPRALRRIVAEALRECPEPEPPAKPGAKGKRPGAGRGKAGRGRRTALIEGAAYSSVVPEWSAAIPRALRAAGVRRIVAAGSRIEMPFSLAVDAPDRVGPDRIAAAAGVVAYGGRDAVVIDAGSAVTVDMLAGGAFLGGAIFPGEMLLLDALHGGTAALPRIPPAGGPARVPGKDTAGAMRAGAFWGLVGAVKELVRRSLSAYAGGAAVWITGGGAEALGPHLGIETRHEPDLVAVGLHYLYKLNEK